MRTMKFIRLESDLLQYYPYLKDSDEPTMHDILIQVLPPNENDPNPAISFAGMSSRYFSAEDISTLMDALRYALSWMPSMIRAVPVRTNSSDSEGG